MTDLTTIPDRQLSDWLFYDDVRTAELLEVDGFTCPDAYDDHEPDTCAFCSALAADRAERDAVRAEIERRERAGVFIDDPNEPSFEERYAPFGLEWQREQDERRR
jgi:hypothetical protein